MKVGIYRDPRFKEHYNGPGHPERAERLDAVDRAIDRLPAEYLRSIPARPATRPELERVHTGQYLDRLEATRERELTVFDADTSATDLSYEVALHAAGAAIDAATRALSGDVPRSFVFGRPPGHHAEAGRAMGFCLLSNAAIAAAAAREAGAERVAVVDWDVHHGNGTESIFWTRPDVFYVSLHQFPHYPGSGRATDTGDGDGDGCTLNVPLPAGTGNDGYLKVMDDTVLPALRSYQPEIVLVSAGFDAHKRDPLAGMNLDGAGFHGLTVRLVELAESCAGGRVVHLLEGGYDLTGVQEGVEAVVSVLADAPS